LPRAALASRTLRFEAVVQKLRPGTSGAGDGAWDAMMVAAHGGDAATYRRLLSEVASWLRRYYCRRLPPPMIDDVVQDALIALHEKRHTYDPSRPFGAWLAAIARYKWIDALRTMKAKPTEALDGEISVDHHGDAVTIVWSLERLLTTLKPSQSEVIRLVKLQGHSIEEASKIRLVALLRNQSHAD
jgi:RNA polymerase sigma factor (sigma-70 family)